jgi:hypothetical protein
MTRPVQNLLRTILSVARDLASLMSLTMWSGVQLAAEHLFLRKPLAVYMERRVKPRRADDATRIILGSVSHILEWRHLLIIVKPETRIRWYGKGFRSAGRALADAKASGRSRACCRTGRRIDSGVSGSSR